MMAANSKFRSPELLLMESLEMHDGGRMCERDEQDKQRSKRILGE